MAVVLDDQEYQPINTWCRNASNSSISNIPSDNTLNANVRNQNNLPEAISSTTHISPHMTVQKEQASSHVSLTTALHHARQHGSGITSSPSYSSERRDGTLYPNLAFFCGYGHTSVSCVGFPASVAKLGGISIHYPYATGGKCRLSRVLGEEHASKGGGQCSCACH